MDRNEEQQYQQMRGEYIGRMASLEHLLTSLLIPINWQVLFLPILVDD